MLLILAGIAINLTIGHNGLFSRAQNAANTWRQAEANEQAEMKNFEDLYDETVNDLGLNGGSGNKKPLGEITGNETEKTDTTDKAGNRIVVPAGFKVVNPEAIVNEGIVIEDVSANNSNTVGNQFVWIPCEIETEENKNDRKLKYDRYAFTRDEWVDTQTKSNEQDADGSYKILFPGEYYCHEAMPEAERASIQANGGYYIGRYEVGCETERTGHTATTEIAKVKAGLNVYAAVTKNEAKLLAEGMYEGKSRLCSSYAWDTALQFIGGTYGINSTGDNYTLDVENTGYHAEKNIYDMGGNILEWTTETCSDTDYPGIWRGGSCCFDNSVIAAGSRLPTSEESYYFNGSYIVLVGFRSTLYV